MAKTKQVPKKVPEEEEVEVEDEAEQEQPNVTFRDSAEQWAISDEEKKRVSAANLYINKSNKRDRLPSPNVGIQACPLKPPWAFPIPGLTAIEMSSFK